MYNIWMGYLRRRETGLAMQEMYYLDFVPERIPEDVLKRFYPEEISILLCC